MPLIFITGISGSGKSTVLNELQKQNYEAHGVDEEGYADWVNRTTGDIVPFPEDESNNDIHEWYIRHRWVLSYERISQLKTDSDNRQTLVFIGGVAEGEKEVWHLFDKVVLLSVDEATIRRRIASRKDNHFGKTPEEMADILKWLNDNQNNYRRFGASIVDATKPINEVLNDVIQIAGEYAKVH